jgi:hypothetical protein
VTADILGNVQDSTGAIVPNATVTIENRGTHEKRTTTTNGSGEYTFPLLQPGTYAVKVTAPGFSASVHDGIVIVAGDRTRVDASMATGAATETVEVTTRPSAIQTDSTTVGSSVDQTAIADLPINGRNAYALVQVAPGVNSGNPTSMMSGSRPADRRQSSSVSANGQSELFNNNLIDGLDNNERYKGLVMLRPSPEAIGQIKVDTNLHTAEVSRVAGAAINVLTKSGTNTFHGSLYEFFRNDITDARNYFSVASVLPHKPELRQNQFGGSLGGWLLRDKTFFFVDFEQFRQIDGNQTVYTSTVPTLYEEQHPGDLSDIGGTVTPTSSIDPTALAYFKLYPAPNVPGSISATGAPINNFLYDPTRIQTITLGDIRIDEHLTPSDLFYFRYSYNGVPTTTPAPLPEVNGVQPGGTTGGTYPGYSDIRVHNGQFGYTRLFSPRLFGNLRGGYTYFKNFATTLNNGVNLNNSAPYLIPNANTCPGCSGLMGVVPAAGYAALGDPTSLPVLLTEQAYQLQGDLTYTRGNHTLKAGASLIHRTAYTLQQVNGKGTASFSGSTPQQALARFFVGQPFTYSRQSLLDKLYLSTNETGAYFQDDWRATPNLTLNMGLRYDVFTEPSEQNGNFGNLDLNTFQLVVNKKAGISNSYVDVAPRFGFAYSPRSSTVVRGGFGLTFLTDDTNVMFFLLNPPYAYSSGAISQTTPISKGVVAPVAPSTTNLSGSIVAKPRDWLNGYVEQFNLLVQQDFSGNVLTVGYVGTLGRRIGQQVPNWDLPAPSGSAPIPAQRFATQLPSVNTIQYFADFGETNYSALQVNLERRLYKGLTVNGNYTWAHALDDVPNVTDGELAVDLQPTMIGTYDYGNSALDVRNRIAFTANYVLPKISGNRLANGWQVNALTFWQTGLPFDISSAVTQGPSNLAYINLKTVTVDRPNRVGTARPVANPGFLQYFSPAAYARQPIGTAGNAGRNVNYGPHFRRTDMSLFRTFPIHKELSAQLRVECFNITNTPNFAQPNSQITAYSSTADANGNFEATNNGSFGSITSTAFGSYARQFQFAAKFTF